MFHVPEKFRIKSGAGHLNSEESHGNNGLFRVESLKLKRTLQVIASDGEGWEHVSVSDTVRCPTWFEMCFIKDLFWDDSDCVVQYHPPKSEYVNNHPYCLHLWRPTEQSIPLPDSILVGIR